ncbi:hypothetical protein CU097_006334, partial [Rhizopus azygosporus]
TFSSGYSNRPGSPSYIEVASDAASSLYRQPSSVSISEKFTALSLRRVSTSEDHADNTSQQPLDEDVVMTESSKGGQMPGSSDRVTKPVSQSNPNSKGYTSKLASWKAMFNKMSDLIDQLMLEMMEEDDPVKIERLDKKIASLSKNLRLLEDRIASVEKPTSGTGNSNATTPQLISAKAVKPAVPIGSIPPFRLLHDASFNAKYFGANKIRPEEVDNDKTFKTIHDFLRKFESTLQYYGVKLDEEWFKYLQISVNNGQNARSINWLAHKAKQAEFQSSKWRTIRDMLVNKFEESFSYQEYREKLLRCKQHNGEYLHFYLDRYIDLSTRAEFTDNA